MALFKKHKQALILGAVQGFLFAGIMALFGLSDYSPFNWKQFVFYFFSFGICTTLLNIKVKKK
ncbi:hypothetical protein ACW5R3_07515 [Bizionia sp. KMM 8389]